ncbi:hypothetical protein YC2023_117244 [Brassica napus]
MEGSPYRKFSFSQGKGVVPGTGHGILHSGESGCLLAGTQRPVSCLGSGEIQYLSICPNSLPLITRFRHRTRGITCALKSTGVAHSQQASLRQDIAPVMKDPRDRVSDFEVNEVPVHEGLFESGFRDRVPSLVAKVSEGLEISQGQLNPPSSRIIYAPYGTNTRPVRKDMDSIREEGELMD